MFKDRIQSIISKVVKLVGSKELVQKSGPISQLGYYDGDQRFQTATFGTVLEKERITRELSGQGVSIVGVLSPEDIARHSHRSRDPYSPGAHPFRDI